MKELKGPVYDVEGKSHYLEIIKHVETLKGLKGPIYEFGEPGHKFTGSSDFTPASTDMKTLHGPRFEIDSEHHYSEIISNANKLKEMHGPIYQDGDTKHHFSEMTKHVESLVPMAKPVFMDERHSYGEETGKEQGVRTVQGPIYVKDYSKHSYQEQPKPDHLKQVKLIGPVYQTDDYQHHFSAIQDHLETLKTLKAPIYETEGKHHYLEIIKHAETLKDLKGPIYQMGEVGHKFTGSSDFTPATADLKTLHGPAFNIDNQHHFSEIISCANKLKEMHGPIYQDGDTKHQFQEMSRLVEAAVPLAKPIFMDERHSYGEETGKEQGVRTVQGPIYVKDYSKHSYQEQAKPDHLKQVKLRGPIYQNDDYRHHFSAIQEHLETLKTLKAPVYEVEGKSHYLEIIKHAEKLKDLKGPIYEVGDVGHKFTGSSNFTPEAADLKTLTGPAFKIDNSHHFSEIISCATKLKEMHGPIYQDGDTKHRFQEMSRLVESAVPLAKPIFMDERHSYGEETGKEQGVRTVQGPIYVKDYAKHSYQEEAKPDHLKQVLLKGTFTLFLIHICS